MSMVLMRKGIAALYVRCVLLMLFVLTPLAPSTVFAAETSVPAATTDNSPIIQSAMKIIKSASNPLETRKEMVSMVLRLRGPASSGAGKEPTLDPQARDQLLKILNDPTDKQARLAIVEALADMEDPYPDFLQPLINVLLTAEPDIQAAASGVLARYRDKNVKLTDQLISIANDTKRPMSQRLAVIETLGKIRSKTTVGALIQLLEAAAAAKTERNDIEEACAKSLKCLTRADLGTDPAEWKKWWAVNSSKSTVQWLETQLNVVINENRDLKHRLDQTENAVIAMAVQMFQQTSPNEADRVKVILQYLSGTIPAQRRAGLELVTTFISPKQSVPAALRSAIRDLIDDPDPQVRRACAKALGDSADREALRQIQDQLNKETDQVVKRAMICAIGQLGDKSQINVLIQELNSQVEQVAIGAAQAIATIFQNQKTIAGGLQDQVIQTLLARYQRATEDQVPLKQELLRAMGMTKDFRFMDLYRRELTNSSPDVRLYAARGLANLGDDKYVPLLIDQLKDSEPAVRAEVAAGIASLTSDQQAVEYLLTRTNPNFEKDNQVRRRTWDAILVMVKRWPLDRQLQWANQLTLQSDPVTQEQMAALADTIGAEITEQTAAWPPDKKVDVLMYFGTFLLKTTHTEDAVKYFRQAVSTTKQFSPEKSVERTEQLLTRLLKVPNSELIVAQYLNALVGILEPDQVESVMTEFAEWTSHPPNTRAASKICHSLSSDLLSGLPDNLHDKLDALGRKYKPQTSPATNTPSTGTGPM